MKLQYGEIFDTAWKAIKDDLALVAGLTAVYIFGAWVFQHVPVLGVIVAAPLGLGYLKCLLQIRAKQVIGYQDFFWAFIDFNRLAHAVLMNVVLYIAYVIGFFLLVLPGIWALVATGFSSQNFVLDKPDAIESIKKSLNMVKGRWWNVFGLFVWIFLINMAGALCLVVGLLITVPISVMSLLIAAEKLSVTMPIQPPPSHPSDSDSKSSEPVEVTILPR